MKRNLFFTMLFIFCGSLLFAQTGIIRGYVKESSTKDDAIGATVKLEGTSLITTTDVNGFFSFAKVPVGTSTLKITYISFKTKIIENINVEADKVTEINTFLEEDKVMLEEVKVTATRITGTEISVISEIKAAQQIVSGISSAQITKTLDRNAAEVVKRVPGVTILGNRFINIRGLNERYNAVMLNNVFTPSMETDVRSFSFDIVPSNQIDRIMVFKSPAAELPGEFSGGVVKIFTKSIPENNFLNINIGGAVRTGTTGQEFLEPQNGKNYWTGFNDGFSDLPKYFPNNRSELISSGSQRLIQVGQSLKNTWTPQESKAMPDLRLSVTGGLKLAFRNIKIGNFSALNYSNSYTNFSMQRNDWEYSQIIKNGEANAIFNFADTPNRCVAC